MKGTLTISNPMYGCGKKKIRIDVTDETSRTRFLALELDLAAFAEAITGLAGIECDIDVHNLDRVGKKLEKREIEFLVAEKVWLHDKELAIDLAKAATPEGWVADTYYGSKDSFFTKDGDQWARTTIRRWV